MASPAPPRLHVGDIGLSRIIEQEACPFPIANVFPALPPEILAESRGWMVPWALDASDTLILTVQSFLVRTPHHTILVDSCVGNDKPRPRPDWSMRTDTRFMDGLAAEGLGVEDIDYVMCTHMHVDHVGWNTRLQDGRWVPTFPKARYIFGRAEYEYWDAQHASTPNAVYGDSVLPVIEAGRAELVGGEYALGDHVRLLPTPGHTPGHVSILLGHGRDDAVVSGDLIHSPLQARHPGLSPRFDVDPVQAAATRRGFLERFCDTDTICCMTHFPSPSFYRFKPWNDGFRCEAVTP